MNEVKEGKTYRYVCIPILRHIDTHTHTQEYTGYEESGGGARVFGKMFDNSFPCLRFF